MELEAGKANPAKVGKDLAPTGINLLAFCQKYNELTAGQQGIIIPAEVTVFEDRSFASEPRRPPPPFFSNVPRESKRGPRRPGHETVATLSRKDLEKIAEIKLPDLNTNRLENAVKMIEGTALTWASGSRIKLRKRGSPLKQNLYTTGQLAEKAFVTIRTLRYYDKVGLLKPSHHSDGGHRLYTDEDLFRLEQILGLKFLGFSLTEIKRFLEKPKSLSESLAMQKEILKDKKNASSRQSTPSKKWKTSWRKAARLGVRSWICSG